MKEFVIEGQKSFWGDKCSDKFRKPSATGRKPVIDDLFAYREKLLEALPSAAGGTFKVGLPRAMSMLDRLPFWQRYFAELGIEAVLSPVTDPRISAAGIDMAVAQPCYPVQVAHGHVQSLVESGVDYILVPNMADAEVRRGFLRVALLPVEPDAALGAALGARTGTASASVPDSDAALPAGPGAGEEGAGGNHAQRWA